MAVIHDVMPAFELFQPATIDDTMRLLGQHRGDAWVMAGGLDTFDWLKDRIKRPKVVVDLSQVKELSGIREAGGGLEIGATTTLTEVVRHPIIREKYSILSTGAEAAASPQIRNQGTIGGNVSQDTRCWYYRAGWPCYRAGGNTCFADTPTAINREHAILGADRCVAVNPSDSAPALIVLDASEILLRESARPERVGFPADERGVGHGGHGRQDRAHPPGGQRRSGSPVAAHGGGRSGAGQGTQRRDRRNGRETGRAGRAAFAVQRL